MKRPTHLVIGAVVCSLSAQEGGVTWHLTSPRPGYYPLSVHVLGSALEAGFDTAIVSTAVTQAAAQRPGSDVLRHRQANARYPRIEIMIGHDERTGMKLEARLLCARPGAPVRRAHRDVPFRSIQTLVDWTFLLRRELATLLERSEEERCPDDAVEGGVAYEPPTRAIEMPPGQPVPGRAVVQRGDGAGGIVTRIEVVPDTVVMKVGSAAPYFQLMRRIGINASGDTVRFTPWYTIKDESIARQGDRGVEALVVGVTAVEMGEMVQSPRIQRGQVRKEFWIRVVP